jgi:hypothetical protein
VRNGYQKDEIQGLEKDCVVNEKENGVAETKKVQCKMKTCVFISERGEGEENEYNARVTYTPRHAN